MATIKMRPPFIITGGLVPGLKIKDATLELRETGFVIYFNDGDEFEVEGYKAGPCHNIQQMFDDILCFLSSWQQAIIHFEERPDTDPEDIDGLDCFPRDNEKLVAWAKMCGDDFELLLCDLEEPELITVES
jgi:hypothetical protein